MLDKIKFEVSYYDSGEKLINSSKSGVHYRLIFMGTCLRDMSGYDAAKRIEKINPDVDIIYVSPEKTVSKEYGVKNSDYFVKPVSLLKIRGVLSRRLSERFRVHNGFLNVCFQRSIKHIPLHRVYYFERCSRRLTARVRGSDVPFYGNLEDIEKSLADYGFIRCHQSFLVNTDMVRKLDGNKLFISGGGEVAVSRSYYNEVCNALAEKKIPITGSIKK